MARVHVASWQTTYAGIIPHEHLATLSVEERVETWRGVLDAGVSRVYVAEVKGQVVGFASGGPSRWADLPYDGELYALYLLAGHQRSGLGRRLVAAVADGLRGIGLRSLVVWVLARNPACRFYERLGGEPVGRHDEMIAGIFYEERAYGWPRLDALLDAARA